MARVTAEQGAQRWAQRLSASTEAITAGVQAVTTAPGALAARQKAAWLQNVTAAADKWAARVSSVSLEDWRSAMLDKGVSRVSSGAQAAVPKMQAFLADFLPHLDRVTASVRSMPKVTLEDGINRMIAQVRGVAQYKRGGR